jgi:hypothetical protein
MLASGAQTPRHNNATESAGEIVRAILGNDATTTKLQEELVVDRKPLAGTEAGQAVNDCLAEEIKYLEAGAVETKALLQQAQQTQPGNEALNAE